MILVPLGVEPTHGGFADLLFHGARQQFCGSLAILIF